MRLSFSRHQIPPPSLLALLEITGSSTIAHKTYGLLHRYGCQLVTQLIATHYHSNEGPKPYSCGNKRLSGSDNVCYGTSYQRWDKSRLSDVLSGQFLNPYCAQTGSGYIAFAFTDPSTLNARKGSTPTIVLTQSRALKSTARHRRAGP
jgi:hypothetical protein